MPGPDRERVPLTEREQQLWATFVVLEARRDNVGLRCQSRLTELLDWAAQQGGLCDHEGCIEDRAREFDGMQAFLWNGPQ